MNQARSQEWGQRAEFSRPCGGTFLELMMKYYTGGGIEFLISPEDLPLLESSSWHLSTGYVARIRNGKREFLHNLLLKKPSSRYVVDHVTGNKLDNTRENLQIVTRAVNTLKGKRFCGNQSRGVQQAKSGKWRARISLPQGVVLQKVCSSFEEAVNLRAVWEELYHGKFKG